jgi:hypothetical protein
MLVSHNFPSNSPQRAYEPKRKNQPGATPIHVPTPSKLCPVFQASPAPAGHHRDWINL